MIRSLHPIVLAAGVGAALAVVALAVAFATRSSGLRTSMILLGFILLLPAGYLFLLQNAWLVDSRFRTYRAFYDDIRIGMTREQVLSVMDRRYPAAGRRQRPKIMNDTPDGLGFFMNPERSREPNCEGIFLTLENGRVVEKHYSPD